ncbi:type IV secretory system conjugative DNA transfer family protein [Pandoraea cepalis]|nr:type IV secretory system conjugative DNA transfer family protein [Pandoraea cepalis]
MAQTVAFLLCLVVLAFWIATQYVAWKAGNQPALGEPLFRTANFALYTPVDYMIWLLKFGHVAEMDPIFRVGEYILLSLHGLFLPALWLSIRRGRKLRQMTDSHGSAHWADKKEVAQAGLLRANRSLLTRMLTKQDEYDGCDIYLAAYEDPRTHKLEYLINTQKAHTAICAPSGSGKGVGPVNTTLLSWRESVIVNDVKKELYALTAGFRKAIGQIVLRLEPLCTDGTGSRFNPLEEIRLRTIKEVGDAQNIAAIIVDPDGKGMDDHWAKTGHELLSAAMLHILYVGSNKTLRGLVSFFCDPTRTIEQVAESMLNAQHDPEGTQGWMDPLTGRRALTHPVVAEAARSFLNKSDNERSGVQSTALSYLSLYRDPLIAENTAVSDFRIRDLQHADRPVSLYIVTPPSDRHRLRPFVRLINNIWARLLTEEMQYRDGRSVKHYKWQVLALLEEFPSMGKMEIFEEVVAYLRSYGITLVIVFQDFAQLYKIYTVNESFTSNCPIKVIYTPDKVETAEIVSRYLGKTTIRQSSISYSGNRLNPLPMHAMSNVNDMGRNLLEPDEVLRVPTAVKSPDGLSILDAGDMLVVVRGSAPIYAKQILYFRDPVFDGRSKIPPPINADRLRGHPDEIPFAYVPHPVDEVYVPRNGDALPDDALDGRMCPEEQADLDEHAPPTPKHPAAVPEAPRPVTDSIFALQGKASTGRPYEVDEDGVVTFQDEAAEDSTNVLAPPHAVRYSAEQLATMNDEERFDAPVVGANPSEASDANQ